MANEDIVMKIVKLVLFISSLCLLAGNLYSATFSLGMPAAVEQAGKEFEAIIEQKQQERINNTAPAAPVLYDFTSPDTDGDYAVRWNSVTNALNYICEEDDNNSFDSPVTIYSGANTSYDVVGKSTGTYYYRVKATNSYGNSGWSDAKSVTVAINLSIPTGMVFVTAGNFTMGSISILINEQPIHTAYLDSYYIDKYEVTNGQYKQFIDAGGYSTQSYWITDGWIWKSSYSVTKPKYWDDTTYGYTATNGPNLPVVGVNWYEACAYAKWTGKRLPTEAEWEKAARGTDARTYPWGNTWYPNYCNWYDTSPVLGNSDGYTYAAPVGTYENDKSPYGCYDMAGNVSEWCNNWYETYSTGTVINPTGNTTGYYRIIRGGSFYNYGNIICRSAFRGLSYPIYMYVYLGFRCAKSVNTAIPSAPSGMKTTTLSSSTILVSWTDSSNKEVGFQLERKVLGGNYSLIQTLTQNTTFFLDFPLIAATIYYYRVLAYNLNGNSIYSAEANATTQSFSSNLTGMALIAAGSFTMGSSSSTSEQPIHTVYLDAYYIDKYEVTNGQYKQFIDAGGYRNSSCWTTEGWDWRMSNNITQPNYWTSSTFGYVAVNGPNLPVVGVSWYEADAYAKWAGKRLPTEAEWEKAARGTDQRMYPWGNIWYTNYCNWHDGTSGDGSQDGYKYTAPIGSYENGKSPYGCYDMAGNVSEWCNDLSGTYPSGTVSNPSGPTTGIYRVLRGGSWEGGVYESRSAYRYLSNYPYHNFDNFGFRCAKSANP